MISLEKPSAGNFEKKRVLVLLGGWSSEAEISMQSGRNVGEALRKLGHTVDFFDPPRDALAIAQGVRDSFGGQGPDVIFNILHGREVEDGVIQGILTLLGIPYTFSDVMSSALAMHKGITCDLLSHYGVRCPRGQMMTRQAYAAEGWPSFPHIVKPAAEGSTVGLHFVQNAIDMEGVLRGWPEGVQMLVEDYIPGRELSVPVLGGQAVGVIEIDFEGPVFAFEPKYTPGKARHLMPAPIPEKAYKAAMHYAEIAHLRLKCSGITRSDFRYDPAQGDSDGVYFLEINTQPGMTALSLVPDTLKQQGWSYEEIVQWILEDACAHDRPNTR